MRAIYTLAAAFLLAAPVYAQKPVRCEVKGGGGDAPKYGVGWNAYSAKGPRTLFLAVGVNPRHFNRDDMTALARRLSRVYCREQRLDVTILDDRRAAREFAPTNETEWFQRHVRGYYELDRTTGKEEIRFTTDPGKPDDVIKISLSGGAPG